MSRLPRIVKYNAAFLRAQQFLYKIEASDYPFDVFDMPAVLEQYYGYTVLISKLSEYNAYLRGIGRPIKRIKNGLCVYDPVRDTYLILYSDTQASTRIRFTIMHEIGHIVLGHLSDKATELERAGLPDSKYLQYEGAANTFAGNVLAPPILIHEFLQDRKFNRRTVQKFFQLSESAVREYREKDYAAWLEMPTNKYERALLKRCSPTMHVRHCPACSSQFYDKHAFYCKICGNETLSPYKDVHVEYYEGIDIDESSRAKICPYCENKITSPGDICTECGAPIVNKCTWELGCGAFEDGDARYCRLCGCKTTFNTNLALPYWLGSEISQEEYSQHCYLSTQRQRPKNEKPVIKEVHHARYALEP